MEWKKIETETREIEDKVIPILEEWLKNNPEWEGNAHFVNYPPHISMTIGIHHLAHLSDRRLEEAADLATLICDKLGMKGKMRQADNYIRYDFWLPKA